MSSDCFQTVVSYLQRLSASFGMKISTISINMEALMKAGGENGNVTGSEEAAERADVMNHCANWCLGIYL